MVLLMCSSNAGLRIPCIFLPSKYFPHMALEIWGARNQFVIFCIEFTQISCDRTGRLVNQLKGTSYPLAQHMNLTFPSRESIWPAIAVGSSRRLYNFTMLYVVNKLGSYTRVFLAYLKRLVLPTPSLLVIIIKSTCQFYAFLRCFYIPCIRYVIERLK